MNEDNAVDSFIARKILSPRWMQISACKKDGLSQRQATWVEYKGQPYSPQDKAQIIRN
jgi:hypothetical protein